MALAAAQFRLHPRPAAPMAQLNRTALVMQPAIPPLHQCHQRGEEILTHLGQPVAIAGALPGLPVGHALKQAMGDQFPQPGGGYRLTDPGPVGELLKASGAVERLAQEQKARARADHIERAGDRAVGGLPRRARIESAGQLKGSRHTEESS